MSSLQVIEEAIRTRAPIAFEYLRPDKTPGTRIGNPHAVFIRRLKSGEEYVYLHLWQTDGVTDSGQQLPSWRQFFFNDVHEPRLMPEAAPFALAEGYNPSYYEFSIAKV